MIFSGDRRILLEDNPMKKIMLTIGLIIILGTMTSCESMFLANVLKKTSDYQSVQLSMALDYLKDHEDPIRLWYGNTITGNELYQFVQEHNIPILWGSEDICGGGSCSKIYCRNDFCTPFPENSAENPIFIQPSLQEDITRMDELVDTLAHEIFHYTQPFGNVETTLFEEYMANYIGAAIAEKNMENFTKYNPMQPNCLVKYFIDQHTYYAYSKLEGYPSTITPEVGDDCRDSQKSRLTLVPIPESRTVCTTNKLGLIDCKEIPMK
jgi:hypothetical protein